MDVRSNEHPTHVLEELNGMRERSELTDVILEVEGRSFPCHRAVLTASSPYFRTMFTSGYAEAKQGSVCIQDVTEVAVATILDYAYTGCLKTEPEQVQAVMSAARLLQVDFVFNKAAEYMKDHLDVSNSSEVFMYADMLGDITLQEASGKYVASRFNQVALQPSFLQLSLPQLQSLINRDDLICSEDDVVKAAVRWTEFHREERLQHLPALSKSFRHSSISTSVIAELESKCTTTGDELVYSNSTDKRLGQMRTETLIFLRRDMGITEVSDDAPCYDPSERELYLLRMPNHIENFSMVATSDDDLYLSGCQDFYTEKMSDKKKVFLEYNHLLSTWETRCDMISNRVRCGLVYLKGYIYAIGGDDTKKSVEKYDPSCDKWTSVAPIPQAISSELCAVALDDSIYVISETGCYRYSATENVWSKMADMLTPPSRPQAVIYQGYIYCVDCDNIIGAHSHVEVYNPTKNTWKCTWLRQPFFFQAATLIPYMGSLYLLTVSPDPESVNEYDINFNMYKYQPETDCWGVQDCPSRMIPPNRWWWEMIRRTDCLVARMIPKCLDGGVKDEDESSDEDDDSSDSDEEDRSDSEEVLDQQNDDDDNNDEERDGQ